MKSLPGRWRAPRWFTPTKPAGGLQGRKACGSLPRRAKIPPPSIGWSPTGIAPPSIETIPADFAGVLVSDCLSVYDGATALQHKCYAHHLRAWRRAREDLNPKQDTGWLTQVRALLEAAIKLRRSPDLSA